MRVLAVGGKNIMIYYDGKNIDGANDFIDLMVKAKSECNAELIALDLLKLSPLFFNLESGFIEQFSQKLKFYNVKVAIFGDFSSYNLKETKKYLVEKKIEKNILLVATRQEAIKILQEI